jgi:hypothetical protein
MVLRLISRSPRGPGFLAPVIGAMRLHRRPLGISVGMPGPHDFAVRPGRARLTRHCGHRIPPPTFMTIAKRPSCGGRTRGANHRFRKNRSEIFLREGLDRPSSLKGLGKLDSKISALRWLGRVRTGPHVGETARRANRNLREAGSLADDRHGEFGTGLRPTRLDETGLVSRMRCSVLRCIAERDPAVRCAASKAPAQQRTRKAARRAASEVRKRCGWRCFCLVGSFSQIEWKAACSMSALPRSRPGFALQQNFAMCQLATNALQQIVSYSITSSARAGVLPDRMSTPRRPDAGVPQRPRPAPDAHASLLKLPPPQIIFCAATPAPGLRPLVWVNAP